MEEDKENTSCPRMYGNLWKHHWRGILMFVVPLIFLPIIVPNYEPRNRAFYLFCVMGVYWMTQVLPQQITGILPIAAMPFLSILGSDVVCKSFLTPPLAIFLGSTIVAVAVEFSNLHTRLGLGLITLFGCSPRRVLLGFIMTSGFMSMWLQNTVVAAFMFPIAKAVLDEFEAGGLKIREDKKPGQEEEDREASSVATGYYLAVCYAATLGGCGTLIGSATNLGSRGMYEILYPNSTEHITFPIFTVYNFPWMFMALILLYPTLLITNFGLCRPKSETGAALSNFTKGSKDVAAAVRQKFEDLGSITLHEIQILLLFLILIFLLVFQSPDVIPGWADLIQKKYYIKEPTPIIPIVAMMFYLPTHYACYKYCCGHGPFTNDATGPLLSWKYVNSNFPWGIIFVLGGGYALAESFLESGLAPWLGNNLTFFSSLPLPILQFCAIFFGVLISMTCANVAACNIVIPLMSEVSRTAKTHPLNLILPATLGCSVAFLFPFSTPPNAFIATSAKISTKKMAIAGIIPTITAILLIYLTALSWHSILYPATKEYPDWAML